MGNIIEARRRKAWSHATYVILNRVRREAVIGTLFIYGGKDYFLTPDDAVNTIFVTMGVLKKDVGARWGEADEETVRGSLPGCGHRRFGREHVA